MESMVQYLTKKLKLKVNQQKSGVDNPRNRQFLGFTFTEGKKPDLIKIHGSRIKRFKKKVRKITKKMRGKDLSRTIRQEVMPITRGWSNYFDLDQRKRTFRDLDGWIRRRVRALLWRQWKRLRTRSRKLISLGLSVATAKKYAYSSKGPWRMARTYGMQKTVSNQVLEDMGYISMEKMVLARSQ